VAANTDKGYFLVGEDGACSPSHSAVPRVLPGRGIQTSAIVGIAATPSGNGYWVVAYTGTVIAFGLPTNTRT